ncbi:MAG: hypothetical protein U9Q92_03810 [archaeon]|nr:hypothetical protein [archaeon]
MIQDSTQEYGKKVNSLIELTDGLLEELEVVNKELRYYNNVPAPDEFIEMITKKDSQPNWLEHYEGIPITDNLNVYGTGVPGLGYLVTTYNQMKNISPKQFDTIAVFKKYRKISKMEREESIEAFKKAKKKTVKSTITDYMAYYNSFLDHCKTATNFFKKEGFQESGIISKIYTTLKENTKTTWSDIQQLDGRNSIIFLLNTVEMDYDHTKYPLLQDSEELSELDKKIIDNLYRFFIEKAKQKTSEHNNIKGRLCSSLKDYDSLLAEMKTYIQNLQGDVEELKNKKRDISKVTEGYKERYIAKKTGYLREDINSLENGLKNSDTLLPDSLLDNISEVLEVKEFSKYTPDDFKEIGTDFTEKYSAYNNQEVYQSLLQLRSSKKTLKECNALDKNIELTKLQKMLKIKEIKVTEAVEHWDFFKSESVADNRKQSIEIIRAFDEQKDIDGRVDQVSEELNKSNKDYAHLSGNFNDLEKLCIDTG